MTESPEHDDRPFDLGEVEWPVPSPPDGFAERTAAKFFDDERVASEPQPEVESPPRRRGWGLPFAGGLAAAAAVALLWRALPDPSHAASDSLTTARMQTIAMSDRALAVASSGTTLEWTVDESGDATVAQTTGSVFYRVEEGGAFDVTTPAGTVSVTGTCFEVETRPMKTSGIKAAAMGAALASAVVVTVYEGSVVFANERGEVALQPGQRAAADANTKPHRVAGDDDETVAAVDEVDAVPRADDDDAVAHARRQERALAKAHEQQLAQEAEIERLRKQVTELGGQPGELSPVDLQMRARKCAGQGRGGDCPFLEPDEDTLREMARCASVKVDFPGFLDNVDSPEVSNYARSLGVTDPNEVAGLQAAADKHYAEFNGRLREIFVELGGDAEMAEDASAATMKSYIADQLDRELMGDVQRHVAEERAGMREPPADLSALPIEEQAFRLHAELGNAFEKHLADQLGATRARELRRVKDGWPGSTSVNSGNCVDPE